MFLERLGALVPRPRRMMLTYHGALAPAAGMRGRVVPPPPLPDDEAGGCEHELRGVGRPDTRAPSTDDSRDADCGAKWPGS